VPARPPLPARSVLLSVLLGSHPPRLPVRTLVGTAELFGISEGTARVALSRLTSDGDVVGDSGTYGLSPRHLERQRDQDTSLRPATRPWRGAWEMAVILPDSPASGGELRRRLERRRLAELRPGVFARPDNLVPLRATGAAPPSGLVEWTARPAFDPAELAARLWDLEGWAQGAEELMQELAGATGPADRLSTAAAMVRHIRTDPVLPNQLLPARWPGRRLRRVYDDYRAELGALISARRDG
jgi:phenylacetic acid degradation operon negative regulatory protein